MFMSSCFLCKYTNVNQCVLCIYYISQMNVGDTFFWPRFVTTISTVEIAVIRIIYLNMVEPFQTWKGINSRGKVLEHEDFIPPPSSYVPSLCLPPLTMK